MHAKIGDFCCYEIENFINIKNFSFDSIGKSMIFTCLQNLDFATVKIPSKIRRIFGACEKSLIFHGCEMKFRKHQKTEGFLKATNFYM